MKSNGVYTLYSTAEPISSLFRSLNRLKLLNCLIRLIKIIYALSSQIGAPNDERIAHIL